MYVLVSIVSGYLAPYAQELFCGNADIAITVFGLRYDDQSYSDLETCFQTGQVLGSDAKRRMWLTHNWKLAASFLLLRDAMSVW